MLDLALFERETLLTRYQCSRRLATRLGAWATHKIALTLTVLENALADGELEKFLLDKKLVATDAKKFAAAFKQRAAAFSLTLTTQAEWQVIADAEEIIAVAGFAQIAATPSSNQLATLNLSPVITNANSLTATDFVASMSSASSNAAASANLRIAIFTAVSSAEKISALGQYAFAPIADTEKINVFLQAIADEDALLRAAAARGLRNFGVAPDLTAALANFAQQAELNLNAERICDLIAPEVSLASTATLHLLAGCVRDKNFNAAALKITLATLAKIIVTTRAPIATTPDFLRLLQARMLTLELIADFRAVFAAIEKIIPRQVTAHFVQEILATHSATYRAWLLAALNVAELTAAERAALLPIAIAIFGELPVADAKTFAVRNFIFNDFSADGAALVQLSAALQTFPLAQQRAALRFTDNALCSATFAPAILTALAENYLALLPAAPKAWRVDLLETSIIIRGDLPFALRTQITTALLSNWTDYAGWPLKMTFENCLVKLGSAAVAPLLKILAQEKNHPDSALFAAALGRIGAALPNDNATHDELAATMLRELSRLTLAENAIAEALYLALGQISARPTLATEINALVRRTLRSRLEENNSSADIVAAILRALGFACRGALSDENDINFLSEFCLNILRRENCAVSITPTVQDGEEIFQIGDEAYSATIPAALTALASLITAEKIARPVRTKMLNQLLRLAENAETLAINWGLVNVTKLAIIFGEIGVSAAITNSQRLNIALWLAQRGNNLTALTALAEIVAGFNHLPQLAPLATAIIERVLTLLQREKNADERAPYLRLLTTVLQRGHFTAPPNSTVEAMLTRATRMLSNA